MFLFGSYYSSLLNLKGVDYAFKEREKTISECIKNGEKDIALAPITSASKYSCYNNGGDIAEDYWMNDVLAKYYGLNSITPVGE